MDSWLALIAVCSGFCFALALVLTQFGLRTAEPLTGAGIAVPTTAVLFILLSPLSVDWAAWHTDSALLFAAAGVFFPVAVTLLTFSANQLIGPNLTGTLGNVTPLFAVGFAVLLLGEVPNGEQWLGIAAICAGIAMLFVGRSNGVPAPALWALGLPLGAALIRGVVQPVVKMGLVDWPNPFAAATIGYGVSALVMAAVLMSRRHEWSVPPRTGLLWFIAVGLTNGAAVLLLYMALARGPVTIVAPLVACYPLITLVLNRCFLGRSRLAPVAIAGILISVLGVGLLLRS